MSANAVDEQSPQEVPAGERPKLSHRELIASARTEMPFEISEQLIEIWRETGNPSKRLEHLHGVVEVLARRLCDLLNAIHVQRMRDGGDHREGTPLDSPMERFLHTERKSNEPGKFTFGLFVKGLKSVPALLEGIPEAPEFNEVGSVKLTSVSTTFQRAMTLARDGRTDYGVPVRGVVKYVAHSLAGSTLPRSIGLLAAMETFVTTRNAAQHGHEWWSRDEDWARFVLSYAVPAFDELLASAPLLGLLTRYEKIEVPHDPLVRTIPDGEIDVMSLRRPEVRPENLPVESSHLVAPANVTFDAGEPAHFARRSATDSRLLMYVGPALPYPSPVQDQKALQAQYRDRLIGQVLTLGRPDRAQLQAFAVANAIAELQPAEKAAWAILEAGLFGGQRRDASFDSQGWARQYLRLTGQDASNPERVQEATEEAAQRVSEHLLGVVREAPGTLEHLAGRTEISAPIALRVLEGLVQHRRIVKSRTGSVQWYRPVVEHASQRFEKLCDWLQEHLTMRQFDVRETLEQLVDLVEVTASFLVEAGQATDTAALDQTVVEIRARYGDYAHSLRLAASPGPHAGLAEPDSAAAYDPSIPVITIEGRAFRVEYVVPFLREFFAAFGQAGGRFQKEISEAPLLVGRTRYLAHRVPLHTNLKKFAYEVACGEGEHQVFFEGNCSRRRTLFALERYLRDQCGMSVTVVDGEAPVGVPTAGGLGASPELPILAVPISESNQPAITVYLSRGPDEVEVKGAGVAGFLRALLQRLIEKEWIDDLKLPIVVSRTRYLLAETPFHLDEQPFALPIEEDGYFAEASWSETELLEAIRGLAEAFGLVLSTDEEDEAVDEEVGLSRCWKIAPEANGLAWEDWVRDGIASVAWEQLGDLGDVLSEDDFARVVRERTAYGAGKNDGVWQAWRFRGVREGDFIVANVGTHTVLGIGRVQSGYEYRADNAVGPDKDRPHPHCLRVVWHDQKLRSVSEPGWRRTLVEVSRERLEKIEQAEYAPATGRSGAPSQEDADATGAPLSAGADGPRRKAASDKPESVGWEGEPPVSCDGSWRAIFLEGTRRLLAAGLTKEALVRCGWWLGERRDAPMIRDRSPMQLQDDLWIGANLSADSIRAKLNRAASAVRQAGGDGSATWTLATVVTGAGVTHTFPSTSGSE